MQEILTSLCEPRPSHSSAQPRVSQHRGVPVEQACGIILTDSVSEQLRYAVDVQRGVELWQYDDALAITQVGA